MGVSPGYPLLLGGMVIVAGAHSIWHLPASGSLSHHFRERRGMALAFHGVGGGLGDAVGPMATGMLLALLTWRELLSFYAVFAFVLGVMAIWAFRDIGRTKEKGEDTVDISQRLAVTKRLLKNPVLWGLALVDGLRAMALVALVTTFPLYLDNDLALSQLPVASTSGCSSSSAWAPSPRPVFSLTAWAANRCWCPDWLGPVWRFYC